MTNVFAPVSLGKLLALIEERALVISQKWPEIGLMTQDEASRNTEQSNDSKNNFSRKHANYIRYSLIQYIGNIGPKTIIEGKQL